LIRIKQARERGGKQSFSNFIKGPANVLDHATSEIAIGTRLEMDPTRKLASEEFKRPWLNPNEQRRLPKKLSGVPKQAVAADVRKL
jgi:hypothetical protein